MHEDDLVELDVLGVRRHPGDDELVVLLLEPVGELVVPIAIGATEAGAIATAQAGVVPPRPMTHDLLRDVLGAVGTTVERVEITELVGGVFHAALVLGHPRVRVDARASDAIALAVRVGCPVMCATEVLAEAGLEAAPVTAEEAGRTSPDEEVAQFREFLDHVSPDDFERGEPGPPPRGSTSGGG
ncbi:bifunctional nuclease family protein [Cellulomonas triticagri]|uniref:Bifunctional nuclease family protein n=1 Tax=Cellulomonas triticagri TaxID=2483352 RepID=A0A3M2JJ19_9CELL|nr:bifunctional nuclease family protein [Cellulomonas triticagri]RMI13782.1 bifunctional nuclease family protein [Cellulomonas triticagri]